MGDYIEINSEKVKATFNPVVVHIPVKRLGIAKMVRVRTNSNGGTK